MGPVENTHFDNDGRIKVLNRAARRRKQPTDNWETKNTHQINKTRNKNAKRQKRERERAITEVRKARKESNSQIS